ncbi:MAG: putative selenium-dependent hydroxylase accessory protein YqeC [Chloroflexi bacterium]|nr:putative selenium-dependent hydroxylase accessory protein YqeC [Chloroflexota bacterium]
MAHHQKIEAGGATPPGLRQAFDVKPGEVISLVGGGGKTTLMYALAQELAAAGAKVVTTTTTRIIEPSASESPLLLVEKDEGKLAGLLLENLKRYGHITLAGEKLDAGKLKGVSPEFVDKLARSGEVSCIIVEADGAARRPLKAPGPFEPVIPASTSLVIPVVGIDALGGKLDMEVVFRPEIVSRLTGLPLGGTITTEAIAILVTHPQGMAKGSPAQARIVPIINKVDLDEGLGRARGLARRILDMGHPRIERVVLGQVQFARTVVEVVFPNPPSSPSGRTLQGEPL